jgi:hypothetical protein
MKILDIVERKMTKKEKSKEKRLKKKYDDSDMKASMKKQYGKDGENVYYATIRQQSMGENASAEEEDEFHRKLDKLVHKTFGHSSDEVEEAYTQSAAPGAQLKGNEKAPKAKAGRTDHPHGGRLVGETTSAGAVAAVATPIGTIRKRNQDEVDETTSASGVSVGAPKGKPRNNTGKNALNSKDNLLGEKSRKVRRTKR